MTSLLIALVLAQADAAPTTTPAEPATPAERAALAAEKAAEAAAKAADAAQRIADKIAPKAPPDVPSAPATPDSWKLNFGLGVSLLGGNTESATLTGSAAIDKKWDPWSLGIRFNGALGYAAPPGMTTGTPATVARRASLTARGDRAFGGFVSVFVLGGGEFDHIKSIESRVYGEGGASFTLFNEKEADLEKLYLKLDVALRGGRETRFTYFPAPASITPYEVPLLSPRLAVVGRWALNKSFRISEEFEALPSLLAPTFGRFLINTHTKLNARITDVASLSLGFLLAIDTQPPNPMLRPYDYTLTAGADFVF